LKVCDPPARGLYTKDEGNVCMLGDLESNLA
jgi:hypothetical protein